MSEILLGLGAFFFLKILQDIFKGAEAQRNKESNDWYTTQSFRCIEYGGDWILYEEGQDGWNENIPYAGYCGTLPEGTLYPADYDTQESCLAAGYLWAQTEAGGEFRCIRPPLSEAEQIDNCFESGGCWDTIMLTCVDCNTDDPGVQQPPDVLPPTEKGLEELACEALGRQEVGEPYVYDTESGSCTNLTLEQWNAQQAGFIIAPSGRVTGFRSMEDVRLASEECAQFQDFGYAVSWNFEDYSCDPDDSLGSDTTTKLGCENLQYVWNPIAGVCAGAIQSEMLACANKANSVWVWAKTPTDQGYPGGFCFTQTADGAFDPN